MKKIIRNIFLGILCVVIIAVSAVAVYLFAPERKQESVRPTVTDANGNVYLAAYGESGETYAAVTDAQGNIWAAEYNSDGTIGKSVASLNDKFSLDEIPKNYNGPAIDETVTGNAYTGNASVVETTTEVTTAAPTTQQVSSPNTNEVTTTVPPVSQKTYLIEKYQKIFESETYLMEFTTNDEDLGDTPIVAAAKNGNILIETSIEGIKCKMLYIAEKDTTYLILDNWRKYSKVPESLMGDDMNMSDLNMASSFTTDLSGKKVDVSTVEIGGKSLTCESYTTDKGILMQYYFDGETLVRLDSTDKDGNLASTYITRITSEVPDETFEIPSNYSYINLSWLGLVAGDSTSGK